MSEVIQRLLAAINDRDLEAAAALFHESGDGLITDGRPYMEELERENVGIAETVQSLSGRRPDQPTRPVD
ncbi:hypothetical protein SAMN04487914_11033 [Arthrobacter sp. ok909]|uniref:hypothetical protein n=1 Tax=Arthrobacter sp. ok909 TaxID=1761746 RepID=UPI00088FCC8B|nr:hypothetical protein [Arthrobacter sp. ok909]SDP39762.1 hypothetical protein SAMN04487914_11033 [Arthrobacter sp. ok909]